MESATYQEGCAMASSMPGSGQTMPGPQAQTIFGDSSGASEGEGGKKHKGEDHAKKHEDHAEKSWQPQGYAAPQGYGGPQGYGAPGQGGKEDGGRACGGYDMGYAGYAGNAGHIGQSAPQFGPQAGPMYGTGPGMPPPYMNHAQTGPVQGQPYGASPQEHACGCGGKDAQGHPGFAGHPGHGNPMYGAAPGYDPQHMENRYGQMLSMCNDLMQGKADPAKIASFLTSGGTHFWKGAIVGAAASLLLTNNAVKSALSDSFSSIFGASKSDKSA